MFHTFILAASTVPSAPDFTDAANTYGSSIARGLLPLIEVLLGVAACFTLFHVGTRALRRWIGYSDAVGALRDGPIRHTRFGPVYQGRSGKLYTSEDFRK